MANLVFDSPVTLVVKTPNQKIDDLRIDCALEWSVEQLKRHLSRVYPTKPVRFWTSIFPCFIGSLKLSQVNVFPEFVIVLPRKATISDLYIQGNFSTII